MSIWPQPENHSNLKFFNALVAGTIKNLSRYCPLNNCIFQVIAVVSIVFIIISTIVLTLNTLPYFEVGYLYSTSVYSITTEYLTVEYL
jgi:hypothetical protein